MWPGLEQRSMQLQGRSRGPALGGPQEGKIFLILHLLRCEPIAERKKSKCLPYLKGAFRARAGTSAEPTGKWPRRPPLPAPIAANLPCPIESAAVADFIAAESTSKRRFSTGASTPGHADSRNIHWFQTEAMSGALRMLPRLFRRFPGNADSIEANSDERGLSARAREKIQRHHLGC